MTTIHRYMMVLGLPSVLTGSARSDASVDDFVWDLSPLCVNDSAWERDRDIILDKMRSIKRFEGKVTEGPTQLADAMDAVYDLRNRTAKLVIYGFLVTASDNKSERSRMQYDVGNSLEPQVAAAVEFVEDEIRSLDSVTLHNWLDSELRLHCYRRRINRILREAPYTLSSEAQAVVENMARRPRMAAEVRSTLVDENLGWPEVTLTGGDTIAADFPGYGRSRRFSNTADRRSVSRAFLRRLSDFEPTFGLLLTGRIEADRTIARHRKFDSSIDAIWYLRDGMPIGSQAIMIDATRRNLAVLQRYLRLLGRAIGIDHLTDADISARPYGQQPTIQFVQALEIATEASRPLGAGFQASLQHCLEQPWMSLAPAPTKNGTYAVFPPIGKAPPFHIMSFRPNYVYSRGFLGGAVLMTAFASALPDRTSDTRDDPGIYSNAMIYVGDMLFDEYMIAHASSREERIADYLSAADLIYRQYFRWVIVCDWERQVENLIARGETPDGHTLSGLFLELSREYYGEDAGVVSIDSLYGGQWMTYDVPCLSYEHEFWPPALAADCMVLNSIDAGDKQVLEKFYRVLGRGELDLAYYLFEDMGINPASEKPYRAVMQRMNRLLDGLEKEIGGGN